MIVAIAERNILAELAETDEIKELRKLYQKGNEMTFTSGGVKALSTMLLGVCDRKIYIGKEADVYYDILDTRDYLKGKYGLLSEVEAKEIEYEVEEALEEADKILTSIRDEMNQ